MTQAVLISHDSKYSASVASNSGGLLCASGQSNVTLRRDRVSECTAVANGGAILLQDLASVTISDCRVFEKNKATYGSVALLSDRSRLSVIDSVFFGNGCELAKFQDQTCEYQEGGVVSLKDSSAAELQRCNFTENRVANRGGAIYASSVQTILAISHCNFTSGAAARGSAVYLETPKFSIESTNFSLNTAKVYGGIYMVLYDQSISRLQRVNFSGNEAMYAGAGECFSQEHRSAVIAAYYRLGLGLAWLGLAGVFWAPKASDDWLNPPPLDSAALSLTFDGNKADSGNGYGKDYASFKYGTSTL